MASSSSRKKASKEIIKNVVGLVIGDPHLKYKNTTLNNQYVEAVIKIAKEHKPTFIAILGDILDTHETIKVSPCKIATEELIDGLARIAPVYLIIGNHDLSDPNQFLTDNHIFNPLKKWKNVTVIDYPKYVTIQDKEFVFCPYVPPGRFVEALDKLTEDGYSWDIADCIFGHQEFYGCNYGEGPSLKGDKWDEDYPPVISGHIHDEQIIGTNVYYPGASMQHSFSESYKKYVWLVDFSKEPEKDAGSPHFHYQKLTLGINRQRMITVNVEDVGEIDVNIAAKYRNLKIKIVGSMTEINAFKKSVLYNTLKQKGVLFSYSYTANKELGDFADEIIHAVEKISLMPYNVLLSKVVDTKDELVKSAYKEILSDLPCLQEKVEIEPEDIEDFEENEEFEESEECEEFDYEESEDFEESEEYEESDYYE